jgi:nucleosome assembly protein 1-like 1
MSESKVASLNKSKDSEALAFNMTNVPIAIMKRVNALKNLQVKMLGVESKFYEELHLLECKYAAQYDPLYEQRSKIINGEYEPTEDESKWELDEEDEEEAKEAVDLAKDLKAKAQLSDVGSGASDVKGVPDFWLQTFKCVDLVGEMIQEHDEPVLKHLQDVKVKLHDQKPYGYTLEFYFNENEFFTNKVLIKSYELRTEYDPKDPFAYEGPDLYKCKGCTIDWKKGKNVTVRQVKKKQKHKGHGTVRVVTKEIKQDSFFNYFDTIEEPKSPITSGTEDKKIRNNSSSKEHDDDDESETNEGLYAADFEIGHFFKERVIPKAVLYFTGEIADEDYDEYDEEDEEDEDGDNEGHSDDDDDDDDDDEPKGKDNHKKNQKGGKGKPGKGGEANNPPECKQN